MILTKKLGSGIATTSLKKEFKLPADQQTNEQKMIDEVMNSMAELNKVGQQAIQKIHKKYGTKIVHGLTDVTGFGFSGHLTGSFLSNFFSISTFEQNFLKNLFLSFRNVEPRQFGC